MVSSSRNPAPGLAAPARGSGPVTYLGSLLFDADDLVLCMFCGSSRAAVIAASGRSASPANGSWTRRGSATTQPRRERGNDQTL
jgi:hypothetical protein